VTRDCLAAPGSTLADGASGLTRTKTCYKCRQEGHVRHIRFPLSFTVLNIFPLDCQGLPRECRVVRMTTSRFSVLGVVQEDLLPSPYRSAMFILQFFLSYVERIFFDLRNLRV
jgi:hypothetical protein